MKKFKNLLILIFVFTFVSQITSYVPSILNESPIYANSDYSISSSDSSDEKDALICSSEKAFFQILSSQMVDRKNTITIKYYGNTDDLYGSASNSSNKLNTLISKTLDVDYPYTSNDFDYLQFNYTSVNSQITTHSDYTIFTFKFNYLTNFKEEQAVQSAVKSILKSLNIYKKSDYEKVKAVHDYIATHTSYDKTLKKHSAYNLLIEHSSVCQGYSLVAYYMLTELGIPNRIILGNADNGSGSSSHSWNIVKLGKKWYNLDITWDDPIISWDEPDYFTYDNFLIPNSKMSTHIRDAIYNTKSFNKSYPMSSKSFTKNMDSGTAAITKAKKYNAVNSIKAKSDIELKKGDTQKVKFTFSPTNKTDSTLYYTSTNPSTAMVNSKGNITALNKGTTTIYACTPNGKQASCTVTVK